MLRATRAVERDLFARLSPEERVNPMPGDEWSPQDVLAHLAAWRAIEARRLAGSPAPGDPAPGDSGDAANARLRAARAAAGWDAIAEEADASVELLVQAVGSSSTDALCECDQLVAGIGANGINHAIGHLSDIARMVGDTPRYGDFADEVERVLHRSHLPVRDSGVLLYNLACHSALVGDLDDARRLLATALSRRPDLEDVAAADPDLDPLRAQERQAP